MDRISTAQQVRQSIDLITDRQTELGDLQKQITTGKRVLKPSDDPSASAQIERSRSDVARLDVEARMVSFAKLKLSQAEGAVAEGTEVFQRSREILLAANNDSSSPEDRELYAHELRSLRDQLFNMANRSDGLGGYIFAGAGTRQEPFVEGANGIEYRADAGRQLTGERTELSTSVDGRYLFGTSSGAGVEAVFDIMNDVASALEDTGMDSVLLHTNVSAALDDIDAAMNRFSGVRAELGEQMVMADLAEQSLAAGQELATQRLSSLSGVDMAEAISSMQAKSTQLDAAMQTYAQISGLSLFNYIR
ncbi:MAG: flagellar hook-associated protein FlgL [Burkholderiaceae bacterium]